MVTIVQVYEGIFYNSDDKEGPRRLTHRGTELHRFMDRYYVHGDTELLSPEEVYHLCRLRASHPLSILDTNAQVRRLFQSLILHRRSKRVLEIGAGTNPVLSSSECSDCNIEFYASDADPHFQKVQNIFSDTHPRLPCPDGHFDIAVAVFVLHFRLYSSQVLEIARCLAPTGVFVANVYRRSEESRRQLCKQFTDIGLSVERAQDSRRVCAKHEYWVIGKNQEIALACLKELQDLNH